MTENIRSNEKLAEMTLERIPLGRWAEPDEIAATFVFLASDAARTSPARCCRSTAGR